MSAYLDANPFALTRQRRAEAAERRREEFAAKYGEVVRAQWTDRDHARHVEWLSKGMPPSPSAPKGPRARKDARRRERASEISRAQDGLCYLCGKPFTVNRAPTQDHVHPRARGGRNQHNILLACYPCNNGKGDRLPYPCELIFLRAVNYALANGKPSPRHGEDPREKAMRLAKEALDSRPARGKV